MSHNLNNIVTYLPVTICDDAAEAIKGGYDHFANGTKPIGVTQAVVIRKGTVDGNATVDFVLEDEAGVKYAFMITSALLKMIAL